MAKAKPNKLRLTNSLGDNVTLEIVPSLEDEVSVDYENGKYAGATVIPIEAIKKLLRVTDKDFIDEIKETPDPDPSKDITDKPATEILQDLRDRERGIQ